MKKAIATMMLASVCACSFTPLTQPKYPPDEGFNYFYTPPNTTTLVVGEKKHDTKPLPVDDAAVYKASIDRISDIIHDETCMLVICDGGQPLGCANVRVMECATETKTVCITADLIDSRGGIHHKPYCPRSHK